MAAGGWKPIGMSDDAPASQWKVAGQRDDPAAQHAPVDTSEHTFLGDVGHNALGAVENAGAAIANIPGGIVNAGADFLARATGHTQGWHPVGTVKPGQAGRDFGEQGAQLVEQGLDKLGAGDATAHAVGATDEGVRTAAANHPALANGLAAAGDVAALAGARGLGGMSAVTEGGMTVPGAISRVVRGTTTAAGDAEQSAALAARQAAYEQKGFITARGISKTGKVLAGDTAQPTAVNNNADVFNSLSSSEARVPHNTPLSYESLEQGRAAPNGVMDRVGRALPEGHLDGPAQIRVNNAGAGITDPASQTQVANMRNALLQPMTGEQRMQQLRQYRQEAYSRLGNEGANSTDQQAVGRAQLDMANAIEDHIGRNLPANGDVSLEQFQAARKALAKNYTVQSALRGTDVDPNVLARIQRADPQLLDGDMDTMARFANENREVVGQRTVLNAPGVAKDLSNVNPLKLGSLGSAVTGGAGPALGRRLITGGPAAGRAAARAATPNAGLGDEFAPLQPRPPQPPEGMTASTPEAPPPRPNGRPGDIPYADVLSHGVEQEPPAGLTAGPMGSPPNGGVPFTRNAAHEAGDLGLADENSWFNGGHEPLGDVAKVMSQGVPEGTVMRTAPGGTPGTRSMRGPGRGPALNMPAGDYIVNRGGTDQGSIGSASPEAINRGFRNVEQVDPDGNGSTVARTVDQIDARPPKGHLLVDRDSGEIIDRGGMNQRMAESLRNRWASRRRLGDTFAPPRD